MISGYVFPSILLVGVEMGEIWFLFVFLSCALSYLKDNKSIEYYWIADFKSEQKQEKV